MMSGCFYCLLSYIYLFTTKKIDRKNIAKMFKLIKQFLCFLLDEMTQAVILDEIIYSCKEMNQMKKVFRKVR